MYLGGYLGCRQAGDLQWLWEVYSSTGPDHLTDNLALVVMEICMPLMAAGPSQMFSG